jgi:Cu(I)/Ag(I) efflux system membrane fusion protein
MDYEPGREWEGAIDYIYPTLDPKTRALKVRVRFDNPNQAIKPEMFATLRIEAEDNTPVLSVPREAVIRGGETDRVVLALGDGRFKSIKVTTGRSDGKRMEILEGLNDGDVVATSAQFLLDSESSKTSDFKRMESASNDMAAMKGHGGMEKKEVKVKKVKPTKASVEATINKLMPEQRKMNVDHGPIPEWKWPSMTMDFNLAESVDIEGLKVGMTVRLEIAKRESGGYEVVQVTPKAGSAMSNHDMMSHNGEMTDMKGMNHD